QKYKDTLDELRRRYAEVFRQRRAMTQELSDLAKTIEGLAALCGEKPGIPRPEDEAEAAKLMAASWLKFVPFADAVRIALRMVAPFPITALELRGLLSRAGYPINQKTDPMVSLNVALTRLRDSEEVEIAEKEGRKAYRWAFRNELRPSSSAAQIDWEALVRT